jgi:hypothetical protein
MLLLSLTALTGTTYASLLSVAMMVAHCILVREYSLTAMQNLSRTLPRIIIFNGPMLEPYIMHLFFFSV